MDRKTHFRFIEWGSKKCQDLSASLKPNIYQKETEKFLILYVMLKRGKNRIGLTYVCADFTTMKKYFMRVRYTHHVFLFFFLHINERQNLSWFVWNKNGERYYQSIDVKVALNFARNSDSSPICRIQTLDVCWFQRY